MSLINTSEIAVLERVVSFTNARNTVLANNIANIDTPGYAMRDLDTTSFQRHLRESAERRRSGSGPIEQDAEIDYDQYLLSHDRNNRNIEKQMTELTKNALLHNTAVDLLRSRYRRLEKAIALTV